MRKLFVGTSGWNYPYWAEGVFYPLGLSQGKWLEFYAQYFNCVEINVTFYRLLKSQTFKNWYAKTPKDFFFVAKGSRYISHIKRLLGVKESLGLFIDNVILLKEKLAAILWQLPPSFRKDLNRLSLFLRLVKVTGIRQAFEFRNESWFDKETLALLKEYNAGLCIAHSSRFPYIKQVTADFLYLRFHGGDSLYSSNYTEKDLEIWAKFANKFKNKDIFAFFNNDAYGYAVKNALEFVRLLKK